MKNKPLELLFDVNPVSNNQKSGVGYYTERLLSALANRYPNDIKVTAFYFNFLSKKQVSLPNLPNIEYRQITFFPSKILNILRRVGVELPIELFMPQKYDFIIYPNFVGFRSLRKNPSAVAIHDLGYLECPEYLLPGNRSFLTRYVPLSIKRSKFVITISEATKSAIKRHYKTPDDKFVITPIPPEQTNIKPERPKDISGKFILFISTLEPRKNFIGLVHGYMQLSEELRQDYSLVLAGGIGWEVESELSEIKQLQDAGEKIVLTGYISQEEKTWLLQNASLFVMPSHYEGFGMPILEAMAAGVPTAVSDIAVFREVAGEASLYFERNDPVSVANTMTKVLVDTKVQTSLRELGHKQVNKLNWDTIAQHVYEKILESI